MAATASAEAGPFWHHRAINGIGEGNKIEPSAPENFRGEGGTGTLTTKIGGTELELSTSSGQVKGAIFNNAHQGQIKATLVSGQIHILKPALTNCTVTFNGNNIVVVKGHLAWKWDGTSGQLTENPQTAQQPDIIFTNVEPQEQSPFGTLDYRKVGVFANFIFTGAGCGIFSGSQPISGSEVALPTPNTLTTFSRTLKVRTIPSGTIPASVGEKEGFLQHVWVGTRFQGLILGLGLGTNPANLVGQFETTAEQQEIAIFEK